MVQLRYVGKKSGTSTYTGHITKTTYRFGGGRTLGWVDERDAGARGETGLLNMRESGRWVFERAESLAQDQTQPIPEGEVPPVTVETVNTDEQSGVTVETVEIEEGQDAEDVLEDFGVDPDELTVSEIEKLDLTPDEWKQLHDREEKGKKRITVLNLAKKNAGLLDQE